MAPPSAASVAFAAAGAVDPLLDQALRALREEEPDPARLSALTRSLSAAAAPLAGAADDRALRVRLLGLEVRARKVAYSSTSPPVGAQ